MDPDEACYIQLIHVLMKYGQLVEEFQRWPKIHFLNWREKLWNPTLNNESEHLALILSIHWRVV